MTSHPLSSSQLQDLADSFTYDRIYTAYLEARRHKRGTANQQQFELHLEDNLLSLYQDFAQDNYNISMSIAFVVTQPKRREVFAATFRDRVVHHYVFDFINDYWEDHFIADSYSCRQGKGTHYGMQRIAHFQRQVTGNFRYPAWVLKLDIQSYFTSINQGIMLRLMEPFYRYAEGELSPDTLSLLRRLITKIIIARPTYNVALRSNTADWQKLPLYKTLYGVCDYLGFPIGNLTSQLFSNIYLNELDHFVRDQLRIKYYGRYVDDMILFSRSKPELLAAKDAIDRFLRLQLGLQINPKKTILQPAHYSIPFVGGVIGRHGIRSGRRVRANFRRYAHRSHQLSHTRQFYVEEGSYAGQLIHFYDGRHLARACWSADKLTEVLTVRARPAKRRLLGKRLREAGRQALAAAPTASMMLLATC